MEIGLVIIVAIFGILELIALAERTGSNVRRVHNKNKSARQLHKERMKNIKR